jgi:hypothetical protein
MKKASGLLSDIFCFYCSGLEERKKDERSSNLWSDISIGTFAGIQSSSFAAAIVPEFHSVQALMVRIGLDWPFHCQTCAGAWTLDWTGTAG